MADEPRIEDSAHRPGIDSGTPHVVLILIIAVGLRCRRLNHWSIWFDEVVTMRLARASDPAALVALLGRIDTTRVPLSRLLLIGWIRIFGHSDLAARALGAVLLIAVHGRGGRLRCAIGTPFSA